MLIKVHILQRKIYSYPLLYLDTIHDLLTLIVSITNLLIKFFFFVHVMLAQLSTAICQTIANPYLN